MDHDKRRLTAATPSVRQRSSSWMCGTLTPCTLWTDIKIIGITAMKVLKRADINNDATATMYPFDGTN